MKANRIVNEITFERNVVNIIICFIMAVVFAGVSALLIYLLIDWDGEPLISLVLLICLTLFIIYLVSAKKLLHQPSKLTVTKDKKIIINNEIVCEAHEVKVKFYKKEFTPEDSILMFILGFLPYMIALSVLGMYNLEFIHNNNVYRFRYATDCNILRLFDVIDLNPSSSDDSDSIEKLKTLDKKIQVWKKRSDKEKKRKKIFLVIITIIIIYLIISKLVI